MSATAAYRIVKLANGAHSVHSLAHAETFHPVVGPVTEAEVLYVRQLGLLDRLQLHGARGSHPDTLPDEFVVWDVGLGAAANPLTLLRAAREIHSRLRVVSFDHTLEPLEFALDHTDHLDYLRGYEDHLRRLLRDKRVTFSSGSLAVEWNVRVADFPGLMASAAAGELPKPHAIMFDAFSPATNPAMWTQPLFARIYQLLDPARPCALPTYSRSTMLRVTLLLAGFYAGVGHPTGEKEETTIAANTLDLIRQPLDRRWFERAHRSTSAEPLWEPVYRQAKLSTETWERLRAHPQFR